MLRDVGIRRASASRLFASVAESHRAMPRLVRKRFGLTEAAKSVTGIYLGTS